MSPEAGSSDTADSRDLHSAVLQTTLQEISSRPTDSERGALATECCVICLDEISEGCETRPCNHCNFDYLCLLTWLERQTACPLCKTEISEVRYGFSDDRKQWKSFLTPEKPPRVETANGPLSSEYRNYRRLSVRQPRQPRPRVRSSYQTSAPSQDDSIARRRAVYRDQRYSLHVGSNRISRYRDLTPQMFASDPDLVSRARTFLRRELQVFEFLSPDSDARLSETDPVVRRRANNAEFLLEYVVAILKTVDMQGSMGQAEELIQEFLGRENTRLLLHELRAWLRSPYMTLENWHRNVQYPQPFIKRRRRSQSPGRERDSPGSANGMYPSTWRRDDRRRHPREMRESRRRFRNNERLREATERYSID